MEDLEKQISQAVHSAVNSDWRWDADRDDEVYTEEFNANHAVKNVLNVISSMNLMYWQKITPETVLPFSSDILFCKKLHGHAFYYAGYIMSDSPKTVKVLGENRIDEFNLDRFTHYCVITPPKD